MSASVVEIPRASAAPNDSLPAAVVGADEGKVVSAFGNEIRFKLGADDTAGRISLGLAFVPAGSAGPPPHVHEREDEIFLIVEGRYRVFAAGEWSEAGPGAVVFLPRGMTHTFQVIGETDGRHWVITNSGDFERFYSQCGEVFSVPGPPNFAALGAIAAEHGMRFARPG
jgi:uncharacterized cupin superfamily protein